MRQERSGGGSPGLPASVGEPLESRQEAALYTDGPWPENPALALEALMAAYGTAVLRLAFFYMRDRPRAEDISQEVFLKAYRAWNGFRRSGSAKAWLMRITVNACRDEMRKRSWHEETFPDPPADRATGDDPEETAINHLDRAVLSRCLMDLPEDIRETVYLYYYFDLATPEIAQALGCAEGTVRSRLARGRDRLRTALEKEGWCHG